MHPCAFLSRRLSAAESNYDVGNRELLAVKVALEEWRHWLEGAQHPFIVWTDHKNLEYIKQAKRLNSRQARWALFFNRFRFTLSYRPGSRNVKPDALSRIYDPEPVAKEPEPILPLNCVVGVVTWQIEQEVKQANGETPPPSGCPEHRLFVPVDLRPQVIHWARCSPAIRESGEPCSPSPNGSGGHPWSRGSGSTSRHVRSVLATKHPPGHAWDSCNLCQSPPDRGRTFPWTSSQGFQFRRVTPRS